MMGHLLSDDFHRVLIFDTRVYLDCGAEDFIGRPLPAVFPDFSSPIRQHFGARMRIVPDFYSTASLRGTLAELVDFSLVNKQSPRSWGMNCRYQSKIVHYKSCEKLRAPQVFFSQASGNRR
jgi:hypothetical protein